MINQKHLWRYQCVSPENIFSNSYQSTVGLRINFRTLLTAVVVDARASTKFKLGNLSNSTNPIDSKSASIFQTTQKYFNKSDYKDHVEICGTVDKQPLNQFLQNWIQKKG